MDHLPRRERFRRDQRRESNPPPKAKPIIVEPPPLPPGERGRVANWILRWWLTLAGAVIAPLATVLIYLPALSGRMIWDDYYYLQAPDAVVRQPDALKKIWLEPKANLQYYPVTFMVFYWEQIWWPVSTPGPKGADDAAWKNAYLSSAYPSENDFAPAHYHWVNILIHAANVLLLWAVLRMLKIRGAWAVALLFGLHPLNVESVAWISELKNVWSAVFALTALLAYMKFRPITPWAEKTDAGTPGFAALRRGEPGFSGRSEAKPERRDTGTELESPPALVSASLLSRIFGATTPGWTPPGRYRGLSWTFYGLAILLGMAAILAKASMIALPAVILLLVWWKRDRFDWRDLLAVLPLVLVGACASPIVKELESRGIWETAHWAHMTPVEKVLVAGRALWFYLRQILCPNHLMAVYPRWDLDGAAWWQWLFPIGFVALLAVLWLVRRRIGRGPLTAVLLMAGTLAPVIGFFFVSYIQDYAFVADHFLYLSMVGILVVAVEAAARLADRIDAWRKQLGVLPWPSLLGPVLAIAGVLVWWIAQSWTFRWGDKPENPPFGQATIPLPGGPWNVPDIAAVIIIAAGVAAMVVEAAAWLIGRLRRGGIFARLHGAMSRTHVALLAGVVAVLASNSIRHEHLLHDWDTLWSTTSHENPDNAKGHFCIGVYALIQDRDVSRSLREMDKSIELNVSHIFLAYFYRAQAYTQVHDWNAVEKEYTRGIGACPDTSAAWLNRATFYRDRGLGLTATDDRVRLLTLSLADFDSAIRAAKKHPTPVANDWLDGLSERVGLARKADPETDFLVRQKSFIHFQRGQILQAQGNAAPASPPEIVASPSAWTSNPPARPKAQWYAMALEDYDAALRLQLQLASLHADELIAFYRTRASLNTQLHHFKAAQRDLLNCALLDPYPGRMPLDDLAEIRRIAATQPGD